VNNTFSLQLKRFTKERTTLKIYTKACEICWDSLSFRFLPKQINNIHMKTMLENINFEQIYNENGSLFKQSVKINLLESLGVMLLQHRQKD
jgi:hypothetical protein